MLHIYNKPEPGDLPPDAPSRTLFVESESIATTTAPVASYPELTPSTMQHLPPPGGVIAPHPRIQLVKFVAPGFGFIFAIVLQVYVAVLILSIPLALLILAMRGCQ
jgi:hypothetical protein